MKIYQSRSFAKKVKKFNEKEKSELDSAIRRIIENPSLGSEKKGDLRGVFVHKLTVQGQMYLLAYRCIKDESLELIMIGPHENHYRDLKTYLKNG